MPRNRADWWWPLALAVLALGGAAAILLSAGTAHADDGAAQEPGASHSEKVAPKPSAESPGKTSEQSPAADDRPVQAAGGSDATERPTGSSIEVGHGAPDLPRNQSIVRHTPTVVTKPTATEPDVMKPVGTTLAVTKSDPLPDDDSLDAPGSTHLATVHDLTPRLAARSHSVTTPAPTTPKPQTAAQPTNPVVLPTALPGAPTTDRGVQQFVRQVIGLASDAGIVGASLVNNLAIGVAAVVGPQAFWGLPYHVATGVADTAATVSKVLSGTPLDAKSTGPFAVDYGVLDVLSFFTPTKVPAGADDPSMKVTAAHPLPVILVNGTVETQALNWSVGAPVLANAGYKVYTFNYGNLTPFPNYPIQSTAAIERSAAELGAEITRVLKDSGAAKVILVGHSQGGGILPAYYLNVMGGADRVASLIGLAPSNHGTDVDGLAGLEMLPILGPLLVAATNLIGPALGQQLVTSPFQQVVYGNGDTRPGVRYTTIASTNDEVVTPYTQQALSGPAVTNIVLQDRYPGLPAGHIGVAFASQTWASVLAALAADPQASPGRVGSLLAA